MECGIQLPHVGPFATPEAITGVARRAEELGYHSLWVSDHIITPRKIDSPYPGGRYRVQPEWPFLEPVSTLLFAAAKSRTSNSCALSLRQCVVFWKAHGKEFMGGATLNCGEAERYVARRNKDMGEGSHWFREIHVNQEIDLKTDCVSRREREKTKHGVPAIKRRPL